MKKGFKCPIHVTEREKNRLVLTIYCLFDQLAKIFIFQVIMWERIGIGVNDYFKRLHKKRLGIPCFQFIISRKKIGSRFDIKVIWHLYGKGKEVNIYMKYRWEDLTRVTPKVI